MEHAAALQRARRCCIQKLSIGSDHCQSVCGSSSDGNCKVVLRFGNFLINYLIKLTKKDLKLDV